MTSRYFRIKNYKGYSCKLHNPFINPVPNYFFYVQITFGLFENFMEFFNTKKEDLKSIFIPVFVIKKRYSLKIYRQDNNECNFSLEL